ncbi:hypothetical protein NOK12_12140 [Nocardioides sp. OK12]|nr:hypothetical protein NOK12_12140 [Nocardioides sp. OK12]
MPALVDINPSQLGMSDSAILKPFAAGTAVLTHPGQLTALDDETMALRCRRTHRYRATIIASLTVSGKAGDLRWLVSGCPAGCEATGWVEP